MEGTSDDGRVEVIDALRGFALLGLFIVHCVELYGLYWIDPSGGPIAKLVFSLFGGKASALFALCFGVSFFFIMDRARKRGENYERRFLWRLFLLLLIGLLHGLIYRGDILVVFALAGGILLLVNRIRNNSALLVLTSICFLQLPLLMRARAAMQGASWAVQKPFFMTDQSLPTLMTGKLYTIIKLNAFHGHLVKWSYHLETGRFSQMVGLFILGLVLGRVGFFRDLQRYKRMRGFILVAALGATLLLNKVGQVNLNVLATEAGEAQLHLRWAIESWMALALLAVQVIILIELFATPLRRVVNVLVPAGRMTLTLYVLQSLIMVPLLYDFGLGLHATLGVTASVMVAILSFGLQILFARWWLNRFLHGPLEWAWRVGTQGSASIPLRRTSLAEARA